MFQIPHQMSLIEDNEPQFYLIADGVPMYDAGLMTMFQIRSIQEMYPYSSFDYVAASELEEAFAELNAEQEQARMQGDPARYPLPALLPDTEI